MNKNRQKNYPSFTHLTEESLDDNSSLKKMLSFIGGNKLIVDFGCASGYFAQILNTRGCIVTGVEINSLAAEQAKQHCREVIVADLDFVSIAEILPNQKFDVAVFGDVLEHLRNPQKVLEDTKAILKEDGFIVASIPNIAHGAIRLALLKGEFEYTELGILDNTHLRFFTRTTVEQLFDTSGYIINAIDCTKVGIFSGSNLVPTVKQEEFSSDISQQIEQDPDANTLQFIIKATQCSIEAKYNLLQDNYSAQLKQIQQLNSQLQQTQSELERSQLQVQQTQSELERSQFELRKLHQNTLHYQSVIQAMESSKFWKLRNSWFKLKSFNTTNVTQVAKIADVTNTAATNTAYPTKVTIVVPIFNAYEDTRKCLDSLLLYTEYKHEILLIDDASTDERIAEFTQKLSSEYSHITCLRNSQNFGFVRNCNIAFSQSKQTEDIVLLNSDTVVTPNWLDKLILAAYSSSDIGTVTPLTNNGTICSVPNWLEENEIPEGYDILSFANLIENISLKTYPKIPTAVGFCMYIKRETLEKVGYFDEINFGKGYGEENDFCCRASAAGYTHIIDDSTFVYHAGSKSFGEQKQKLIKNNLAILSKLHPNYLPEVEKFIIEKPIQNIITNIWLNMYIERIRKFSPICFILHNTTEESINPHLGGTEYHCAALITELSQTHPIYTLYFNTHKSSIDFNIFFKEDIIRFAFTCHLPKINSYLAENTNFLNIFSDIIKHFQPSIIHIHHLINLPILDISAVIKQEKIPYFISIHDYYFICPSYNLIDYQQRFCFEHKNEQYCQKCIQSLFCQGKDLKQKWSYICERMLGEAELIIVPSITSASYINREYEGISDKVKVIRHGIFTQEFIKNQTHNKVNLSKERTKNWNVSPLKVGIIGSINISKGGKVIAELIEKVNSQHNLKDNFEFYFFGRLSPEIPIRFTNFQLNPSYKRQELKEILDNIDVVIFPAIWAETYCLTADEVIFFGVPIISSPIGAIAERVKEFGLGWVSPSGSPEDLINTLLSVKSSNEDYEKVKINIDKYHIVSYEEMAYNYMQEYKRFMNNSFDINQNIPPKSTTVLTLQDIFAAYNQELRINQKKVRMPLSEQSIFWVFLKNSFFGVWEFFRFLAIRLQLIK
jgi:GT2 family glycosyltransferase/glycosyltransferase involved in cell wall biosynthesis/2-polyprenyl-3-methyl-5-hydroxy-6-metoxy-1,4-benzoquinol methylase